MVKGLVLSYDDETFELLQGVRLAVEADWNSLVEVAIAEYYYNHFILEGKLYSDRERFKKLLEAANVTRVRFQ